LLEIKPLSICNFGEVVGLYRKMIEDNIDHDERLKNIDIDDRSLRNMLQYSFDIENALFYVAYLRNMPIGFIDSVRISRDDNKDEWYIKSIYLEAEFRGSNFFQQLVLKVEKEVRNKSIACIFSNSLIDDDEANKLWENLGYILEGKKRIKVLL